MTLHLHFICKQGMGHKKIEDQIFESGEWVVSEKIAEESVGGRIFLHEHQSEKAWHGGLITAWRKTEGSSRIIFTFIVDQPFRIKCTGNWAQEKAIVRL